VVQLIERLSGSLNTIGVATLAPVGTRYSLGFNPALTNYSWTQCLTEANPDTARPWTDAQIQGAYWGLWKPTLAHTQVRVTQLYLEVLTSLQGAYGCGGANYSYGH
jgi:hypothetical protein